MPRYPDSLDFYTKAASLPNLRTVSLAPSGLYVAGPVVVMYKWLEELLAQGCTEKVLSGVRHQLRLKRCVPSVFTNSENAVPDACLQWSVVLPCRVCRWDIVTGKSEHVDIVSILMSQTSFSYKSVSDSHA
jgi:hypothetical protein